MSSSRLILHKVVVFDAIKGNILHNKTIVIKENKVSWIGDYSNFEKEKHDTILSVSEGEIILPGLIDCHVHVAMQMGLNYEQEYMRTKTHKYSYFGLKNSWLHLVAGFTTLRDCGSGTFASSLRDLFATGYFPGPSLLVAQRPIAQHGNQEFVGPKELYSIKDEPETISGTDGVIHAVRERIKSGSDFIKTMTTGGVLHGQSSKLGKHFFNEEELDAMVTEAIEWVFMLQHTHMVMKAFILQPRQVLIP
jgi:imidazolonepropionase-like amidohydrolase